MTTSRAPAGGTAKAAEAPTCEAPPSSCGTGIRDGAGDAPGSSPPATPRSLDLATSTDASSCPCPPSWEDDPEQWHEAKREMERRAAAKIAEVRRKAQERQFLGLDAESERASQVGQEPQRRPLRAEVPTQPSLLVPAWMEEGAGMPTPDSFDDAWAEMLAAEARAADHPEQIAPARTCGDSNRIDGEVSWPRARASESPAKPGPANTGVFPTGAHGDATDEPARVDAPPKPVRGGAFPKVAPSAARPKRTAERQEAGESDFEGVAAGRGEDAVPEASRSSRHAWDEAVARAAADAANDDRVAEGATAKPASEPHPQSGSGSHAWDTVLRKVIPERAPDAAAPPGRSPWREADPASRAATHFDEGFGRLRGGDVEGALSSWRQALELDPQNRTYQANLAKLEVRLAELGEADVPTSVPRTARG